MPGPSVKLSVTSNAAKGFRARAKRVENTLPNLLRRAARLAAVSLAKQTQPFGDDDNAQGQGQAATARDILLVYLTPGKAFGEFTDKRIAALFWWALQNGKIAEANVAIRLGLPKYGSLEIKPFDGGKAHQALRNSRGRIPKGTRPSFIVSNPPKLFAYIAAEQKLVGYGKGGWSACARALGSTRGIPGWVSRQKSPGQVTESISADRAIILLENSVPYATDILNESQKREAIENAAERLLKALVQEERAAARAAGF